jgi:hypothetical protein
MSIAQAKLREHKPPKLDMAVTGTGRPDKDAPVVQKKGNKFADTALQMIEETGERLLKPWEALFPKPPKRDLTPLVYQIWNKIKRELAVDRERRAGGF